MPLVKVLGAAAGRLGKAELSRLHSAWCGLWSVPPEVLQIVVSTPAAMYPDRILLDIRAKQKADRTETALAGISESMAASLTQSGLTGPVQVRIELFAPLTEHGNPSAGYYSGTFGGTSDSASSKY